MFTVPYKSRLAHGVSFKELVLTGVEVYILVSSLDNSRQLKQMDE